MKRCCLCLLLLLAMGACQSSDRASQPVDISRLVPADLSFAKDLVQLLSNGGWKVQRVLPSKFNGFFKETQKAAYIETNKGTLEAVFFDGEDEVRQILITEDNLSGYHKYVLKSAQTTQVIEGNAAYFRKYRNALIIATRQKTIDELNGLLPP